LVVDYLDKNTKVHQVYTEEEVHHFMMPRDTVIESFVVEDTHSKKITDFVSFYALPSSILKHDKYKTLNVAYSYYNIAIKTP